MEPLCSEVGPGGQPWARQPGYFGSDAASDYARTAGVSQRCPGSVWSVTCEEAKILVTVVQIGARWH